MHHPQYGRAILVRHVPIQHDQGVTVVADLFQRLRTVRGTLHQQVPFDGPRLAEMPDRDQTIRFVVVHDQHAEIGWICLASARREAIRFTGREFFH
jgi:hypothetical protein